MYAIIEDSGTQIKVAPGDVVDVDLRDVEPDAKKITFDRVLLVGADSDGDPAIGTPYVDGAAVTAEIVGEVKGDKIDVVKFKRIDGALDALKAIAAANFDGNSQKGDLRARLAEIDVPIDVVWGERDQVLPARHAEGLPDSVTVTVIPGGGHIVHMEKSADVNAIIAKAR